ALAGREDGTDQQQLGVAPRPLLQEHRRECSDEGGEAGWQAWHGGVSRRGCASLSLPRAPPASRPRPPLGRPPNLPPNGQSRAQAALPPAAARELPAPTRQLLIYLWLNVSKFLAAGVLALSVGSLSTGAQAAAASPTTGKRMQQP